MKIQKEIERLLAADGAVLLRSGCHKVYRLHNGKSFVMPKTPSDCRANLNSLSNLRAALGVRRTVYKNCNRKYKPGKAGSSTECFEYVEMKPSWKEQLAQINVSVTKNQRKDKEEKRMSKAHYKVEFDPTYKGGDYTGSGNHVLIPEDLVIQLGMEDAFAKVTGHDPRNIVHYESDLRYDENGVLNGDLQPQVANITEPEIPKAQDPEPAVVENTQIDPEPEVQLYSVEE